jgi:hypothetical protein
LSTRKKRIAAALIVLLVVAAVVGALFYRTQTRWVESAPYARKTTDDTDTLVVVYSRTGNTLSAAKAIARAQGTDLLRIRAPQYSLDLKG